MRQQRLHSMLLKSCCHIIGFLHGLKLCLRKATRFALGRQALHTLWKTLKDGFNICYWMLLSRRRPVKKPGRKYCLAK
eukprot:scaffold182155_cov16-Tisochrysis_lutea.AAC.1